MTLPQLIPVLQVAIGPVILVSGVGLLLLSMTNRLGRTIDRARELIDERRHAPGEAVLRLDLQLGVLWCRARTLRAAITLAVCSALLAAVLMIVLFIGELVGLPLAPVVALAFAACMACLVASLAFFLHDINLSLRALAHEMPGRGPGA